MIDSKIFNESSIILGTTLKTKAEVFEKLASYFYKNNYCDDTEMMIQEFWNREAEGSTAFINGIGIPHAKAEKINYPGICILKNNTGIEWDSLDGEDTSLFIALAIPEKGSSSIHLKMLSSVARKLADAEFKNNLLAAKSKKQIYELISSVEIV
ncbi:PTS system fructose-specific IIA component [Spiroplasma clarkii]|uniref:PTS system, fructose-specific IIA component n=1 Tax=Spiroplasma clarkii TaxID=2139 RepID=A0A1Y0KZ57_9MOLU|nr:PTS sugar transporter subunit IIA [Spiroplasma clarkii]ARU90840.1 PTS system fructose-specific IIA component [Spiroplasma clarkii]ATX71632.1 PTS system, fructose-specific IIA component [Spiroplasma clarkii]